MYYLGVDGGGTKTKVCIINSSHDILFIGESGPSSIDTVTINQSFESIKKAYESFFLDNPDILFTSVFFGIGGVVNELNTEKYKNILMHLPGIHKNTIIKVRNDVENALYSGLLFDEGIALICGTGSVAYAKNKSGDSHKAGGWGFKEGDYGSSYDLGKQAIKHLVQSLDGRESYTDFSEALVRETQIRKAEDIISVLDKRYLDRTWIANLSKLVTHYAIKGDKYAQKIIENATFELAKSVYAVATRLGLECSTLVIVGSLGHAIGFHDVLLSQIYQLLPNLKIIKPQVDPAVAASMMAMNIVKSI